MKNIRFQVIAGTLALSMAMAPAAQADHGWSTAGKILTGVILGQWLFGAPACRETVYVPPPVYVPPCPPPVYMPPPCSPPVYVPPPVYVAPPVYVQPRTVMVVPAPVYVRTYPRPVYVAPRPVVRVGAVYRVESRPVTVCPPTRGRAVPVPRSDGRRHR